MFHTMFYRKLSHWSPKLDIDKNLSNIDDELVYINLASLDYVFCGGISLQGGCFPKINFIFSLSTLCSSDLSLKRQLYMNLLL